jgi:hypothetical protein
MSPGHSGSWANAHQSLLGFPQPSEQHQRWQQRSRARAARRRTVPVSEQQGYWQQSTTPACGLRPPKQSSSFAVCSLSSPDAAPRRCRFAPWALHFNSMNTNSPVPRAEHPAFEPPSDPQVKIWRYMDFTQFVSTLEEKGLLFTRADLLVDKFEGTMSQPLYDYLERNSDPQQHADLLRRTKGWSFVNCWHMNEFESAAMWKLYSTASESVCLQTTYARLRNALAHDVYIGKINYISYERDKIPAANTFWPLMHKRKSFEHERELRAVWSALDRVAEAGPAVASGHEYQPAPEKTVWKQVDLVALTQNIFVSPTAKSWFSELVKKVLRTYNLGVPVRQSDFAAEPLFY